jgi:uncharacterized protein YraI
MQIKKNLIRATIAGAAMVASAGVAFATSATVTDNINVRSGPSGRYAVIDTLRYGDSVEVLECQAGWCYVEKRGPDGWVSSSYLALPGQGYGGGYYDDNYYYGGGYGVNPGVTMEFNFGSSYHSRPPRYDHREWSHERGDRNDRDRDRDDKPTRWE